MTTFCLLHLLLPLFSFSVLFIPALCLAHLKGQSALEVWSLFLFNFMSLFICCCQHTDFSCYMTCMCMFIDSMARGTLVSLLKIIHIYGDTVLSTCCTPCSVLCVALSVAVSCIFLQHHVIIVSSAVCSLYDRFLVCFYNYLAGWLPWYLKDICSITLDIIDKGCIPCFLSASCGWEHPINQQQVIMMFLKANNIQSS